MATIGQLRKEAKDLGIPASLLRGATSADLQKMIDQMGGGTKTATKSASAKSKPAARVPARGKASRSTSATTKRRVPAAAKATTKTTSKKIVRANTDDAGRHALHEVDYTYTDGWNAREGSPPDRIISALRKHRGNRTKVFDTLRPKIWDFVGKTLRNGQKRTMESAEEMLRYRISRTAWDFAMKTGQHEASTNRVEYGTGGSTNGTAKKSTAKKAVSKATGGRKTASKPAAKKTTTTARATTQKASQARTTRKPVAKKKRATARR